jgi:alkylation response protein AidB-like acyl-CoA dehydrogenase
MTGDAITTWLRPLRPILDPTGTIDWPRFASLDAELATLLIGADLSPGPERSTRLKSIRNEMASRGFHNISDTPALFQVLAQFMCGYHDIDLRDTVGLGHGQLIAHHAPAASRERWIPQLRRGELAGIAITEPHGGSRPAETRTQAVSGPGGTWLLTGRKTWISRLTEAAVFVVFFRDPSGNLAAATVSGDEPGLRRHPIAPTGLAGWTWGILDLDAVPVHPTDAVLSGDGMTLLRNHFAAYRPLVTATALGGAAAVFDTVSSSLAGRQTSGEVARPRDSTLITLGRSHAQLVATLLGCVTAARLAEAGFVHAETWSCAMKAYGIDTAHAVVSELALLVGADGYRADSAIAKTHRDLGGLLYADGIHDSLYRAAGKHHTGLLLPVPQPRTVGESADAPTVLA